MQYLWEKFNVKTFPAETVVFVDGEFRPELSDPGSGITVSTDENITITIDKCHDIPVHIIYVGEIDGDRKLYIKNKFGDKGSQLVFFTVKLHIKKPAFLQFFIENAGKNSTTDANIVIQNESDLKLHFFSDHLVENTGLFVKNRVLAHENSNTELYGSAKIVGDASGCESDMSFSAMCAPSAKIKMSPNQRIASVPDDARHSASIYRGTAPQIQFLGRAGMTAEQIKKILEDAFIDN